MSDLFAYLDTITRPRLLVRAARAGATRYNRNRHLRRLFRDGIPEQHSKIIAGLIRMEAELAQEMKSGDANYSVTQHVHVLTALLSEARQEARETTPLQTAA